MRLCQCHGVEMLRKGTQGRSSGLPMYACAVKARERGRLSDARLRAENRSKFLALKGLPCERCGNSHPHWVMDFHHTEARYRHGLSALMGRWNLLVRELEKCELLCANCHKHREWEKLA